MNLFLILTPILVAVIVGLLGFVGCTFTHGAASVFVQHVHTTVNAASNAISITSDPLNLSGGELLIVTLQWNALQAGTQPPSFTGASLQALNGGGPFDWSGQKIQSFLGFNAPNNPAVTVTVTFAQMSPGTSTLCVSAYSAVDTANPVYSPVASDPAFIGATPTAPSLNANYGDMVHAVGFAADNNGKFPGTSTIAPGTAFTAENPGPTNNPLVEDKSISSTQDLVQASVTITAQGVNPRGFVVAMGIKVTS
jgi:hypothetical protein